ncbi:MAG: 30S ribosome-binding factor RbfA [Candidatus Sumerlaeaceae bacterium]
MALHSRMQRVNEEIRAAIAEIVMTEVKDPRVAERIISVNRVVVSKDLHYARVWVSVLGSDAECRETVAGLNHSRGYIKRMLGERVVLKYLPDLHFDFDPSVKEASRLLELFRQIEGQGAPRVESSSPAKQEE